MPCCNPLPTIDQWKEPKGGTKGSNRGGILTLLLIPVFIVYVVYYVVDVTSGNVSTSTHIKQSPARDGTNLDTALPQVDDLLCIADGGCWVNALSGTCRYYQQNEKITGDAAEVARFVDPVNTFQVVFKSLQGGQNMGLSYGTVTVDQLFKGTTSRQSSAGFEDPSSLKIYRGDNLLNRVITKFKGKYEYETWSASSTAREGSVDVNNNNCCNAAQVMLSDKTMAANTLQGQCSATDNTPQGQVPRYYQSTLTLFPTYTEIEVVDPWFSFVSLLGGFMGVAFAVFGALNAGIAMMCDKEDDDEEELTTRAHTRQKSRPIELDEMKNTGRHLDTPRAEGGDLYLNSPAPRRTV